MINTVKQTIDFYLKYNKKPELKDLQIEESLLNRDWNIFVTIYLNGEINWSSWNIKEIKTTIAEELIENTINAISKDPRFEKLRLEDIPNTKIRVDEITGRNILQNWEISKLEPVKFWVIAIKKDYNSLVTILPNISASILSWEDFIYYLWQKLGVKKFKEDDYIIYSIETKIYKDF